MLTAFTAGLLLITVSELGDKTFFIAMLLAMRHARWLVFSGVVAALAAMTILSVMMGQAVSFLPQFVIDVGKITLFVGFGCKLLYDASRMPPAAQPDDCKEALEVVNRADATQRQKTCWGVLTRAFTMTFLAEWGDRTQVATIALAASHHPFGVAAGAILGHAVCAAIAVIGGCLVAGRISERSITALGGVSFLLFAGVALI